MCKRTRWCGWCSSSQRTAKQQHSKGRLRTAGVIRADKRGTMARISRTMSKCTARMHTLMSLSILLPSVGRASMQRIDTRKPYDCRDRHKKALRLRPSTHAQLAPARRSGQGRACGTKPFSPSRWHLKSLLVRLVDILRGSHHAKECPTMGDDTAQRQVIGGL